MQRTDAVNRNRTSRASARFALVNAVLLALAAAAVPADAQNPAIVFSQTTAESAIGSTATATDYGGTVAHYAFNRRGDLLANVSASGAAYILDQPYSPPGESASTVIASQLTLMSNLQSQYGEHSLFVDKNNNIYVADQGQQDILYIPYVNGAYPQNVVRNTLINCSAFPVPATQTSDCIVPLNYPSSLGTYVRAGDLALDGDGNLYILAIYTGGNPQMYPGVDVLTEVSAATGQFTLIDTTLANDVSGKLAVNTAGDIFVEASGTVYYYAAGTTSSSRMTVTSLAGSDGVSMDANGNLFSTQSSSIEEIPYAAGAYNLATPFIVSNLLGGPYTYYTSGPSQSVAVSDQGRITYAGSYPNSLSSITVGGVTFGATPVATASGSQQINLVFNSAETIANITATGPFAVSSTVPAKETACANQAYAGGGSCTVSVIYNASAPGLQTGALVVYDANNNLLGQAVLTGSGQGANLNVDPGTNSQTGSGYTSPAAAAVDNLGNTFVADTSDSGAGTIYKTQTGSTTPGVAVATGFSSPSAVAVDGDGNLYVADSGNSQIVEVPFDPATGVYGAHITLATGLSGPSGLALDDAGDLYVADSGNARVLLLASSGGLPVGSISTTFGTGFIKPVAVAVDNADGYVYVSDAGAGQVVQVGTHTLVQADVVTGLTTPAGVAVDAAGDLFAVDSGAPSITRVPFINGSLNPNSNTLSAIVPNPTAIAVDNAGNLYVIDTTDALVSTDLRSAGLLSFGNLTVGDTSSVVSALISDGGNASFSLSTPYYTESGATSSFAIQSSSSCAAGATLNQGQSCALSADFTPQSNGTQTDTLTLASSAPNSATLALSGVGVAQLIDTTVTLQLANSSSPSYGQAATVIATIVPASQGPAPPSGVVTFEVNNVTVGTANLSNGTASFTFTGHTQLSGGANSITASYSGDSSYAASNDDATPLIVTVGQSATTTTVIITPSSPAYANPTSANPGVTPVVLVANIVPPVPGTPTGTVTFYNGSAVLGTAPVLSAQVNGSNAGQATLTLTNSSTSPLPTGQYEVTAKYSGDSNYSASSSSTPVPLLITAPSIQMTASSNTITGGGAPVIITVSQVAGFNAAVNFTCTGLPKYSTCSFGPAFAAVDYGAPATISFEVLVNQPPVEAVPSGVAGVRHLPGRRAFTAFLTLFLLLPTLLLAYARRASRHSANRFSAMRLSAVIAFLLITGAAATLSGCGTSSGTFDTPAGTSTITVNGLISTGSPNPPPAATLQFQLVVP
jgi:sugar lactone lactonase YvrE